MGGLFHGSGWVLPLAIAAVGYFYAHYAYASIAAHMVMFMAFALMLAGKGAPTGWWFSLSHSSVR